MQKRTIHNLEQFVGQTLLTSEWVTITQAMIQQFADATGDHQWIHLDTERAKRESPFGTTIAHGFLILSLVPMLAADILQTEGATIAINYGADKVRFISPVPSEARVRLHVVLSKVEREANRVKLWTTNTFELEHSLKPACIAEWIVLLS